MNPYTPDKWLLLKITTSSDTFYRVFATWSGGYLSGDSWRLNSGVILVTQEGSDYCFHGNTGSLYSCHKNAYGVAGSSNHGVLDKMLTVRQEGVSVKVLDLEEVKSYLSSFIK